MFRLFLRRFPWAVGMALMVLAGCESLSVPATATTTPTTTAAPTLTVPTATAGNGTPVTGSTTWASFLVASTQGRGNPLSLTNVNAISGKNAVVGSVAPSNQVTVDAIAPDGQSVAYHTDAGTGTQNFFIAKIDGSGSHAAGQVQHLLGQGIWMPDGKHLAVGTTSGIVLLDAISGATTTISQFQAFLVFPSPDGKYLYGTGNGANTPQGALMRIPVDGSAFLQLTARVTGGHFVLNADGSQVFYQNTGPSGTPGIYQVNTQTGSQTQLRTITDIPVGFSSKGNLLTVHSAQPQKTWSLNQLGATAGDDKVLVTSLLPSGVQPANDVVTDVAVAPDGSGAIVRGSPVSLSFHFYFIDLTVTGGQPQQVYALDNASRADLIGWNTVLLPASS